MTLHRLMIFVCALGLGTPGAEQPAKSTAWRADPAQVRRLSESRPEFNYQEDRVPGYTLPDPLRTSSGQLIDSFAEWEAVQRPAILDLFRTHVYGRRPGRPQRLAFHEVHTDPQAMDGAATLKEVDIICGEADRTLTIRLTLFLPNRAAEPVPTFLLINHRDPSNTDPARRERSGFWPAEELIARNYGIAAFHVSDVDPDQDDGFSNGVHGLFGGPATRDEDSWATLSAWGWGASRALDYFERDPAIDASRTAVVGHSRGGKAALWAGAEDSRFALTISNDSGCGGAALSRRRYGETVGRINTAFPHWFCANFNRFNGREDALPIDQHMLIALMAPRAVYVASASEDLWADPKGEFLSLVHAAPVYALWGLARLRDLPPVNTPQHSDRIGFHIREGVHNLTPYDWQQFVDFADQLWSR